MEGNVCGSEFNSDQGYYILVRSGKNTYGASEAHTGWSLIYIWIRSENIPNERKVEERKEDDDDDDDGDEENGKEIG